MLHLYTMQTKLLFAKIITLTLLFMFPVFAWAQYGLDYTETGIISYYPYKFNRTTASGEVFDSEQFVAGHKKIPFNSRVRITNLNNGKMVTVRVNDRGPYAYGRIMDISEAAARKIDLLATGTAKAKIEVIEEPSGNTISKNKEKPKDKDNTSPRITASNEVNYNVGFTYSRWGTLKTPTGFTHQVGSFFELAQAQQHCKKLDGLGFKSETMFIQAGWRNDKKIFNVLIGEFPTKEDGEPLKKRLQATLGVGNVWTKSHPK